MFDLTVLRSRTGVITSLILAGVAACSSEDPGNPFTGGATTSSTVTDGTGGGPSTSAGTTGVTTVATTVTSTATSATTGAGGAAGSGGATGTGGSGGSGGTKDVGDGGVAKDGGLLVDAGTCTPGPIPAPNAMYPRIGWGGQWTPMCKFMTGNGNCTTLLPINAFDGKGTTRTSIGDTHIMAGGAGATAQMIGDTFTFDMTTCNRVGRIVMFAAAPPNNQGSFDARDFPGAVDVTVSSDCTTSALGAITGTFGPVVAMGTEPQPGCMGTACNMPMTITFAQPVPAKCVRLTLTRILQLGGGIWWAIDELQVFP